MIPTLKAEFKKLLTVRSTYIWTGIMLVITMFLSTYVYGYRMSGQALTSTTFLYDAMYLSIGFFGMAATILAILLVTHEYRYRTIEYTLTASNSRLKVLAAKTTVMFTYALLGGLLVSLVSYLGLSLGLSFKDVTMVAQDFPVLDVAGKLGVYLAAYTLVGLVFGLIFRSVIIAIVAYFVIPSIEGIASMIIKGGVTKYLPFSAFDATAASPTIVATAGSDVQILTQGAAIVTSLVYMAVFATIAAVLFIRRDAN